VLTVTVEYATPDGAATRAVLGGYRLAQHAYMVFGQSPGGCCLALDEPPDAPAPGMSTGLITSVRFVMVGVLDSDLGTLNEATKLLIQRALDLLADGRSVDVRLHVNAGIVTDAHHDFARSMPEDHGHLAWKLEEYETVLDLQEHVAINLFFAARPLGGNHRREGLL
jgi:hypothetical protein